MARVVRFYHLGGPEVLEIEEQQVAEPREGEVRIDVRALGLNRAESLFRSGIYIEQPEFPSGSGLEAAGVVESVGPRVTGLSVGDHVALVPPISMRQRPVHAELVNFPAEYVVPMPAGQPFEEAAATWMAFLTAYGTLIGLGELGSGDHVVITAASSSVGLAAIQIVNAVGGVPIAVTRSNSKRATLLEAGAAHVVTSDNDSVAGAICEVSGDEGPRVILDAVGGRLLPELVAAAATGGIIVSYGAQDARTSDLPPAALLAKSLTIRGYLVHELVRNPAKLMAAKTFILDNLTSGALRPIISRTFALEDIRGAYEYLEAGEQVGKVVVTV
jgi:NADPH:quinone reductase-like Zn-dependent oxidoreductase